MNKQNFLIISVNDGGSHNGPPYSEIAKITSKSIINYCSVNNYYYAIQDEGLDKSRSASWNKVYLSRQYSKDQYDYIWCVDADVMLMNHNIELESIVDPNFDVFITCYDNNIEYLNTGSIIYKNSEWTRKFLDDIWNDDEFVQPRPGCYFEQSAIIKYYKNNPQDQHRFKFLPVRTINSHYHGLFDPRRDVNFQHGDLVVHLPGTDNQYRMEVFPQFEKYIIKKGEQIDPNFSVPIWMK